MPQPTLSSIVKRHFVHCVNHRQQGADAVVEMIGVAPGELCQIIAGQHLFRLPLHAYYQIAQWLQMPLANVVALAGLRPRLADLIRLGMVRRGYQATNSQDQIKVATEAGISVAVLRRALHGYADFRPSIRTCDQLADWLSWSGFTSDDIAAAADMVVRYLPNRQRITVALDIERQIEPYPCACGRAGCMVPAHIPNGPRRKWHSDACRMWAKRQAEREAEAGPKKTGQARTTVQHPPIKRFIVINERRVPARF